LGIQGLSPISAEVALARKFGRTSNPEVATRLPDFAEHAHASFRHIGLASSEKPEAWLKAQV
jgi:hypothetical protein